MKTWRQELRLILTILLTVCNKRNLVAPELNSKLCDIHRMVRVKYSFDTHHVQYICTM